MSIAKTKLHLLYRSIELLVFGICISQIGPWKYITINNHKLWHFYVIEKCSNCSLKNIIIIINARHFMRLSYYSKWIFAFFAAFYAYIKKLMFWPGTHLHLIKCFRSLSSDSQSITGHKIVTCKKMFKFYRQFFESTLVKKQGCIYKIFCLRIFASLFSFKKFEIK